MSATTRSTRSGSEPGTNIAPHEGLGRRVEVLGGTAARVPSISSGVLGPPSVAVRVDPDESRDAVGQSERHFDDDIASHRVADQHRRSRRSSFSITATTSPPKAGIVHARRPPPDSPCPARSTATTSYRLGKVVDLPRSSRSGRTTTRGRTPAPARPHLRRRNARRCRQRNERCPSSRCYLATSTARLSRITITFTWPGYSSWSSISRAISCERRTAASSSTSVGSTITRISRPAWSA